MNRPLLGNNKVLDAKAVTGIGVPVYVGDYRHVEFEIATTGGFNGTVKMKASMQKEKPDFAASQTPTNRWSFVQMKSLADASTVDGATGITSAGTDKNQAYEVNTNMIYWICPDITAISAGAVTGYIDGANDDGQ